MLKVLLVAGLVVVVAGFWFVRGSAGVPQSASPVAAAAPTAAAGDGTVELTESALSDHLNDQLAGQPLGDTPLGKATLTRLTTQLKPDQLVANGDAQVGGRSVPVT